MALSLGSVALKNVMRNKARAVLTVLGTAMAIVTFLLVRTCIWSFTMGSENAQKDRIVTRHKVSFVLPMPHRYLEAVKQIPGVQKASFANWFGGKDPAHETEFFGNFAVDKDYFVVANEMAIEPAQLQAWQEDKQGAIIGDALAKKLGWKVGDTVHLDSSIYPATSEDGLWTFHINAIYTATQKSVDRSSMMFHWEYMNDALPEIRKDTIGWVFSRVQPGASAADVGRAIDAHFDSEDTQTLSQDEKAFAASFLGGVSAVLTALDVVSIAILAIMLLVLGNTIAMGVRERTQEYGVLRAIGFLPKHLVLFIVGEAVLTAALGGVVGIALAYPIVQEGLGRFIEENMGSMIPYFRIPVAATVAALFLSMLLGLLASLLPAWGASRIKVVNALRYV